MSSDRVNGIEPARANRKQQRAHDLGGSEAPLPGRCASCVADQGPSGRIKQQACQWAAGRAGGARRARPRPRRAAAVQHGAWRPGWCIFVHRGGAGATSRFICRCRTGSPCSKQLIFKGVHILPGSTGADRVGLAVLVVADQALEAIAIGPAVDRAKRFEGGITDDRGFRGADLHFHPDRLVTGVAIGGRGGPARYRPTRFPLPQSARLSLSSSW